MHTFSVMFLSKLRRGRPLQRPGDKENCLDSRDQKGVQTTGQGMVGRVKLKPLHFLRHSYDHVSATP